MLDVWPVFPNWAQRVEETFQFRTEILSARDGTEQRICQRTRPRLSVQFYASGGHEFQRATFPRLAARQGGVFRFPHPTDRFEVLAAYTGGVPSGAPWWWGSDNPVMTVSPAKATLLVEGGTPALPTDGAIGPGWLIHLVQSGRLGRSNRVSSPARAGAAAELSFQVDPVLSLHRPEVAGTLFYRDREVFDPKVNWSRGAGHEFDAARIDLDMQYGAIGELLPKPFVERATGVDLVLRKAEASSIVDFFYRHRGRQKSFWIPAPSGELDLIRTGTIASSITVAGEEAAQAYVADLAHRHLRIDVPGRSPDYVAVTGVAAAGGNTTISFSPSIEPVSAGLVNSVSWLHLSRLSADRLTLRWETSEVCTTSLTTVALEDTT